MYHGEENERELEDLMFKEYMVVVDRLLSEVRMVINKTRGFQQFENVRGHPDHSRYIIENFKDNVRLYAIFYYEEDDPYRFTIAVNIDGVERMFGIAPDGNYEDQIGCETLYDHIDNFTSHWITSATMHQFNAWRNDSE